MHTTPASTSAIAPAPVRGSGPPGLVEPVVGTWNVLIALGLDVGVSPPGGTVVVTSSPAVVTDDGTVDVVDVAPAAVVLGDGALEDVDADGTVVDADGDDVLVDGSEVVLGDGFVVGGTVVCGTVVPVGRVVVADPGAVQWLLKIEMPRSVQFLPA